METAFQFVAFIKSVANYTLSSTLINWDTSKLFNIIFSYQNVDN